MSYSGGRLSADRRGQTGPIGVVLVLGMVVTGTVAVLGLGAVALSDTQTQSELERAEHSMTLFDSRAAMVALGDSDVQAVSFGQDSGSFQTRPNEGWMRITHVDYNGSGDDEVIFNRSLGSLVYTNGDTTLAYQGGGVWRRDGDNAAYMISPPEFHYREATLTLPVIRLTGPGTDAGTGQVVVSNADDTELVYPNVTASLDGTDEIGAPYNGTEDDYTNPVQNGTVNVTVQSDYYEGWAQYFRTRTDGNVRTFDSNETVHLQLTSFSGSPGDFDMPLAGDSVEASGIASAHPFEDFTVDLATDGGSKSHFSFYATEDNREFELHVKTNGNAGSSVDVSLYYYNGSGAQRTEEWQNQTIEPSNPAVSWDGDVVTVDLLSDDVELTYQNIDGLNCGGGGGGNKWRFNQHIDCESGWELADTTTWDEHAGNISWEGASRTYDQGAGDTETLNNTTNHYLQLMGPEVELETQSGPGNSRKFDLGTSTGTLEYSTAGIDQYITFIHVTENEVEVDVS